MRKNLLKCFIVFSFIIINISCRKAEIKENRIQFDGVTFTVISPSLIGLEVEENKFPFPKNNTFRDFDVEEKEGQLIISTAKQKLIYSVIGGPVLERINIEFKKNENTISSPVYLQDKQNLGGVIQRADRMDGRLEHRDYDTASPATPKQFPNGLLSSRGFTILKNHKGRLMHNDTEAQAEEFFIFCYGNDFKLALKDFTNLNGKIPMLPKWSLGNWFSRYQPLKDTDYKNIVNRFRKEKIPIDVIVPDMNWHKDGWYGTRFDEENFPDMPAFLKWTNDNGVHVGFNHHPGALIPNDPRSKVFAERTGLNLKELVKSTDSIYKVTNWENIKGTAMYGEDNWEHVQPYFKIFLEPIMDLGLDFHWVDGTPSIDNLREYYNATQDYNDKRAIVLTRQGYGSFDHHKYPIGFSADTYMSWESLKYNIEVTLAGANNGVYWSHDIGGHMAKNGDNSDQSELFTRWIQFGAMSPFNRLHATGGVTLDKNLLHIRRPWEWGDTVLNSARKMMQLKYKMMPYLYTLNRNAFDTGLIMTRGMYFDYPEYAHAYNYGSSQYMIGSSVLVAPITTASEDRLGLKGMGSKNLWIPDGTWYDYFTGEVFYGPLVTLVKKPIDEMPLYIKEGAIIPMRDYVNYTDEKPLQNLLIEFYQPMQTMHTTFDLYEDDGKTLSYKNNAYRSTKIEYVYSDTSGSQLTIHPVVGSYKHESKNRTYTLKVKHLKSIPNAVFLNDEVLGTKNWSVINQTLFIQLPKTSTEKAISIHF